MTATTKPRPVLADRLRDAIVDGTYGPGVQLREVDVAAAFGVSRNSLRAAFRDLAAMGLVEHVPNRGVFVRRMSEEDIDDHYVMRAAIETEAARVVALRRADLAAVASAVERLDALPADAPWHARVEADLAIHRALVACSASPRLTRAFAALEAELLLLLGQQRGRYDDRPAELTGQHHRLLRALRDGDPYFAQAAAREHLRESRMDVAASRD
jgi:DNA-binding GntR family transcriptional regulator